MYFDSHAHLDEACFQPDFDDILARMAAAGVTGLMDIGCDRASSLRAVALAEKYPWIWAAIGSHPDSADEATDEGLAFYRELAQNPRVRAVGEIGLDYHYETIPRERQKDAFRRQMALAQELRLPVVVHEREAHGDGLAVVDEFPGVRGVFHCYSGSLEMAKELVKRGWYIGFTGVVTFKNARRALEVAEWLPLERMLIETDCPYMAPEPYRGRRNDPSFVPLVAVKLAELKGLSPEAVAAATEQNARTLFRLEG